jgi:hypothetical protein
MKRIVRTYSHELAATPDEVFPLLCPVREYDWLPYWKCEMIHSDSGIAELDCIFKTALPEEPEAVWTCSRYEPNQAIEYIVFSRGLIHHLSIRLSEPVAGRTRLQWRRVYSAFAPDTEASLTNFIESRLGQINGILTTGLEQYLGTRSERSTVNA